MVKLAKRAVSETREVKKFVTLATSVRCGHYGASGPSVASPVARAKLFELEHAQTVTRVILAARENQPKPKFALVETQSAQYGHHGVISPHAR